MPRPFALWLLLFMLMLLGLGGLYGGSVMLADPAGHLIRMRAVLPLLPVRDYTLPGVLIPFAPAGPI